MSIIDKALEANRNYAKTYDPTLGKRPTPPWSGLRQTTRRKDRKSAVCG
jgi:hypothetical protein